VQLYPDIVTTLIGSMPNTSERDGVLLCIRNDSEKKYTDDEIKQLKNKLQEAGLFCEVADTNSNLPLKELIANFSSELEKTLDFFARHKVVITDRYHGTIFSMISNTPVIVIATNDHKVKTGIHKAGEEKVGGIVTCDIGIPIEAEYFINYGDMIKLNKRSLKSHKGNNGKVLIVGGSKEYSGAPSIAGLAAIGAGADLVYVAAPESAALAISTHPDLIVNSLKGDYLTTEHAGEILEIAEKVDAVLLGPGAGINNETGKLLNILASKIKKPLVLDADALKQVKPQIIKNRDDVILTPHIFEFKSFFGKDIKLDLDSYDFAEVDENISEFQQVVRQINGAVVVKGAIDLVIQKNKFKLNKSGNPGMTVGGTGDALAGIATSLLSKGLNAFDAATLAIFINGLAGDEAYLEKGYGFGATDVVAHIGKVIKG
jgi:hydroxyethylthiazole kinase-like uncharacterized protein yjeF